MHCNFTKQWRRLVPSILWSGLMSDTSDSVFICPFDLWATEKQPFMMFRIQLFSSLTFREKITKGSINLLCQIQWYVPYCTLVSCQQTPWWLAQRCWELIYYLRTGSLAAAPQTGCSYSQYNTLTGKQHLNLNVFPQAETLVLYSLNFQITE